MESSSNSPHSFASSDSQSFLRTFTTDTAPPEDALDEFCFETDYLALKGNHDYLKLMKALAILDVQRTKICQDIDQLETLKMRVAEDPEAVKKEIFEGNAPYLQRLNIYNVPDIDLSKYRAYELNGKNQARRSKPPKPEPDSSQDEQIKVRGRVYHEKKPETFNQLWTVEEQLRLEALLIEYPPEPIENQRYRKIAAALGNRTTKQVCSRVQKYYKKMQKAGLGMGKRNTKAKCAAHVNRRHKHFLYKPTTFFPGSAMKELDSDSGSDEAPSNSTAEQPDLQHWVEILKKISDEKNVKEEDLTRVNHFGYECGSCGENPIKGTRWECRLCPSFSSCSDCMAAMMSKPNPAHSITHQYKAITDFINTQYTSKALGSTNYLDPNHN